MVATRSGGKYRGVSAPSKRGRGQSQRSRRRQRSPDNNGDSPARSVDKTPSVASVESTLTPLSSLHRGESTVNVPVVGDRDADRPQALLHERQEGRGVRN